MTTRREWDEAYADAGILPARAYCETYRPAAGDPDPAPEDRCASLRRQRDFARRAAILGWSYVAGSLLRFLLS